jgi:anti-sigma factor RsiW
MPEHVHEWLNAYVDGELKGSQLQSVETHLVDCQSCQADLESLERLSIVLHEVPAPAFTPAERFAAQLNLRLPQARPVISRKRMLEVGWWMIPVGLVAAWVFISTTVLVNDLLSAAHIVGLLSSISDWVVFSPATQANWSATLGQFGILSGNHFNWAATTEAFTKTYLPQISLHVSIALLYLSWLAIGWARYRRDQRQQHGQLLES